MALIGPLPCLETGTLSSQFIHIKVLLCPHVVQVSNSSPVSSTLQRQNKAFTGRLNTPSSNSAVGNRLFPLPVKHVIQTLGTGRYRY